MAVAGHMLLRKSLNRPEMHLEVNPFNVRFSLIADLHQAFDSSLAVAIRP